MPPGLNEQERIDLRRVIDLAMRAGASATRAGCDRKIRWDARDGQMLRRLRVAGPEDGSIRFLHRFGVGPSAGKGYTARRGWRTSVARLVSSPVL